MKRTSGAAKLNLMRLKISSGRDDSGTAYLKPPNILRREFWIGYSFLLISIKFLEYCIYLIFRHFEENIKKNS